MEVGIIGLGRMGTGVATRLIKGGHTIVTYNRTTEKTQTFQAERGGEAAFSLEELVNRLAKPRVVWLYLPAGEVTQEHISALLQLLEPGDTIIDGGNSHFSKTLLAAAACKEQEINWLDVGTSGGISGETDGYCLMIGADKAMYELLQPLWHSVAQEEGVILAGPAGAGHYTKMVHNGIEYGVMQAYAEGINLLENGSLKGSIDVGAATAVWQKGSIIRSHIGYLVQQSVNNPEMRASARNEVEDNGECRWAVEDGIIQGVPMPVTTASLYARFDSRSLANSANRLLNVVRNLFGGHRL